VLLKESKENQPAGTNFTVIELEAYRKEKHFFLSPLKKRGVE
jgi:hypothetical protein